MESTFWIPACGKEFLIVCMCSQSLSVEDAGDGSWARRQSTESYTCSIDDISGE